MDFLRTNRGAVIVVSHDLILLDEAITRVLHLDAGRMVEYRGTYSQYQAARKAEEVRLTALAQRQQAEIKRLSVLAEVMRRQTEKRARTAKSIFKRVDRLKAQQVSAPRRERKVKIRFPIRRTAAASSLTRRRAWPRATAGRSSFATSSSRSSAASGCW